MDFHSRKVMNILITADTGDTICIIYCVPVCVRLCWKGWSLFTFGLQARTPAKTGGFRSCGEESLHTGRSSISRFNTEIFPEPKLKTATWRCANEGCATTPLLRLRFRQSWWKINLYTCWPSVDVAYLWGNVVCCNIFLYVDVKEVRERQRGLRIGSQRAPSCVHSCLSVMVESRLRKGETSRAESIKACNFSLVSILNTKHENRSSHVKRIQN